MTEAGAILDPAGRALAAARPGLGRQGRALRAHDPVRHDSPVTSGVDPRAEDGGLPRIANNPSPRTSSVFSG